MHKPEWGTGSQYIIKHANTLRMTTVNTNRNAHVIVVCKQNVELFVYAARSVCTPVQYLQSDPLDLLLGREACAPCVYTCTCTNVLGECTNRTHVCCQRHGLSERRDPRHDGETRRTQLVQYRRRARVLCCCVWCLTNARRRRRGRRRVSVCKHTTRVHDVRRPSALFHRPSGNGTSGWSLQYVERMAPFGLLVFRPTKWITNNIHIQFGCCIFVHRTGVRINCVCACVCVNSIATRSMPP